jgi:cytochrome b pre-mRNA-processing protein 3
MRLGLKLRPSRHRASAAALYAAIVDQARRPAFYADLGVPDTVDGRFDMIALHAFLVLRKLRGEPTADLAQELFDVMFDDMDRNLREMGAGDLGVGPRVKTMAKAFYGRIAAYDQGLAAGEAALGEALRRNLYRKAEPPARQLGALVAYVCREAAALNRADMRRLIAGDFAFGSAPTPLCA